MNNGAIELYSRKNDTEVEYTHVEQDQATIGVLLMMAKAMRDDYPELSKRYEQRAEAIVLDRRMKARIQQIANAA